MEIKEERFQAELRQANISLILDGYNDIFSDFDPRPFSQRALSDDFLIECRRAAREKSENGIELILTIPRHLRNLNDEINIKKRLMDHFRKHAAEKEKEVNRMKKEGRIWVLLGVLILIGVVYGLVHVSSIFLEAIITILEIPSWFLVWEGLRKILIDSKEKDPEKVFYRKMAHADILFRSS